MTTQTLTFLAVLSALLPLLSFVLISFFGKEGQGGKLAQINIFLSFILSIVVFSFVWNGMPVHEQIQWFSVGQFSMTAGILLNNLSVLMLLLVSGISLIVHVYSVEYMRDDPMLHRYWAYLGLFCFSMLSLVIADNLLLVYTFWELVGFSSYLLIGFWFTREIAAQAAKKAFIMNRIGDLGFLAGLMIVFTQFRTFDLVKLFGAEGLAAKAIVGQGMWISGAQHLPVIWLSIAGLAFLVGAMAKSAQFPLHTWLPDAMAGPTSVSSLIHAATMVAAGIFLIARLYPVFDPSVLLVMTSVGTLTAFMAASIALVQNDIKKILAYSTISQLGFMMLAMGTGSPAAAVFHLATHAFFKCLLFLAAGSVIHQVYHFKEKEQLVFDHQDIRNMGGLRKMMPVTFITMLLASLALAGAPLTSGYLSKDTILIGSFEWASSRQDIFRIVPYIATITSWMTSFYISRLLFKTFFGEFRWGHQGAVHESSRQIRIPLIILALFCLFPAFSINPFSSVNSWIVAGMLSGGSASDEGTLHLLVPLAAVTVSAVMVYLAYLIYVKRDKTREHASGSNPLHQFLDQGWYLDRAYLGVFVKPLEHLSRLSYTFDRFVIDGIVLGFGKTGQALGALSAFADKYIIDASVNMLGSISKSIGNFTRQFQSGRLQNYMVTMLVMVLVFFILKYFSQAI